jgi:hypothetical protein
MHVVKSLGDATFEDLTEEQPDITKTAVETAPPDVLPEMHRHWVKHGWVTIPNLIPTDVIDNYAAVRERLPKDRRALDNYWGGWHYPTPYMDCPELLDLATHHELQHVLGSLIAEPVGLHLALTGWVSTERRWHQDSYLNPEFLWSFYVAAWIALDDVDGDSGPFEFIDGSHTWPVLRREKLFRFLTPEQRASPDWPTTTQGQIERVCEAEISKRGALVSRFVPKKGDVLIWHSNLIHRGSIPHNSELLRKSLICHYSSVVRRLDMNRLARNPTNGSLYFDLPSASAPRM